MISKTTRAAVATLAAVGLALIVPAATAQASVARPGISEVPCGPSDYLQVWWDLGGSSHHYEACYANAGGPSCFPNYEDPRLADITTGNNRVQFDSQNSSVMGPNPPLDRWTNTVYHDVSLGCIQIL